MPTLSRTNGRVGIVKASCDHMDSVNETYLEHMRFAGLFGFRLLGAAFAAFAHAIVPAWFEKTASNMVRSMYGQINHRGKQDDQAS